MAKSTLNKDITITGALSAANVTSSTLDIPANKRVVGIEFTEIANANTKNYDIRIDDNDGIRLDYAHRLSVCAVIAGATAMNVAFKDRRHDLCIRGSQTVTIQTKLIDALTGGQSVQYRVAFHLEDNN